MKLLQSYAFQVRAQRKEVQKSIPTGGRFDSNEKFETLLLELAISPELAESSAIALLPDDNENEQAESVFRGYLLELAFGADDEAKASALQVAVKLGDATDGRSWPICLLVIAVFQLGDRRNITMWSFPREDVFRMTQERNKPNLELLSDVFSKSSKLRKAATFTGTNARAEFWSGKILDEESGSEEKKAADYWMKLFLHARFEIDAVFGTNQVVGLIKRAMRTADPQMREELFAMSVAIPVAPKQNWTPKKIASRFLSKGNHDRFLATVPEELRESNFEIDKERFKQQLNFRVFETKENVWLSAPNDELGRSVTFDTKTGQLQFAGTVVRQELKARHVK